MSQKTMEDFAKPKAVSKKLKKGPSSISFKNSRTDKTNNEVIEIEAEVHAKEQPPTPPPNTQAFLEEKFVADPAPKKVNHVTADELQGCPLTLLIQEAMELTDNNLAPLMRTMADMSEWLESNPQEDNQMEYK